MLVSSDAKDQMKYVHKWTITQGTDIANNRPNSEIGPKHT